MLSALLLAMPALTGNVSVLSTNPYTPVEEAPANTEANTAADNSNSSAPAESNANVAEPAANANANNGAANASAPAKTEAPANK